MRIVSFDCANKSLGVSILNYNLNISKDIKLKYDMYLAEKAELLKNFNDIKMNKLLEKYIKLLDETIKLVSNKITIEFLDVVDLIPGKKVKETDPVYRTDKLYDYLNNIIDPLVNFTIDKEYIFLLEFQMGPNVKSGTVSAQIMYHLMKYKNGDNIKLIGPSLKNKIIIGGSHNNYKNYIEKYTTNYGANKAHSKQNFLDLLKYLDSEIMIKDIKKKNIDDIADSVLMSLAFVLSNEEF